MGKILLTDVDGVLLDWKAGYVNWMMENPQWFPYGIQDKAESEKLTIEGWLRCTHDESRESIAAFNDTDAFGELKPYADAEEYIAKIHAAGYSFVAITACKEDAATHERRTKNLKKYFGNAIADVHCVGLRTAKDEYLKRYQPTFWFEDSISHAHEGIKYGHNAIVLDHYYNQSETPFIRAKNWSEIYHCILDDGCTLPNWIA